MKTLSWENWTKKTISLAVCAALIYGGFVTFLTSFLWLLDYEPYDIPLHVTRIILGIGCLIAGITGGILIVQKMISKKIK